MALIDELAEVNVDWARCRAVVRADNPFLVVGRLPAWILVEYMAQSVAVFAGYARASGGGEYRHGLLLGCRNLWLADVALEVGSRLEIEVNEVARYEQLGSFNGKVTWGDTDAAKGTISVYETREWPTRRTGCGSGRRDEDIDDRSQR